MSETPHSDPPDEVEGAQTHDSPDATPRQFREPEPAESSTPAAETPPPSDPEPAGETPESAGSGEPRDSQSRNKERVPKKKAAPRKKRVRSSSRQKKERPAGDENATQQEGGSDNPDPEVNDPDSAGNNPEKIAEESENRDPAAPEKRGDSGEQPPPRETKAERHRRRRERRREQREKEREREASMLASAPAMELEGLVEISPKGFGFLRQRERAYQQAPDDVFITPEIVRIHGLRDGVWVKCRSKQGNRGPQLVELLQINGKDPAAYHNLPYFEELTAINPNKRLALETKPDRLTTRIIDMMTPIGRGQRGLIVAPPRTGKTTFLHHIAEGILENYEDEVHLMVMLIDERPEEVTDFVRSFPAADVFASSNDADVKSHTRMSLLAIERAKRLVEAGEHVFILLDSITRLARAFNNSIGGGKNRGTQSGGIAVGALEIPRKLFAAARNTREAGSLTIIATALIQTNSKMDEAIFQEFKGTGNLELVLDRQLAQNYVYPAVDINRSGTRREELLIPRHVLEKIYVIRRGIAGYKPIDAMEWLIKAMGRYQSNAQMLMEIRTSAVA